MTVSNCPLRGREGNLKKIKQYCSGGSGKPYTKDILFRRAGKRYARARAQQGLGNLMPCHAKEKHKFATPSATT